jgi:hypothetical protein
MALSISRSNLLTKKTRSTDYANLRKSPPKADATDQKDAIACIVKVTLTQFPYHSEISKSAPLLFLRQGFDPFSERTLLAFAILAYC